GSTETEDHVLFNCPIQSSVWTDIVRWLGIPIAFAEEGYEHFQMFKGLISSRAKVKDILIITWLSTVHSIWKARNDMIFNHVGFNWEKVVDEIKISAWKILKASAKDFSCSLYDWNSNPLECMGMGRML
ncbi:hypothetical protein A2U01_0053870, partial [Trifolium medium]|nr:hypothetical protein [Trifolium medium]